MKAEAEDGAQMNQFHFGDESSLMTEDNRLHFDLPPAADGASTGDDDDGLNQFDSIAPGTPQHDPEAIVREFRSPDADKASVMSQDNQERLIEFEPVASQHHHHPQGHHTSIRDPDDGSYPPAGLNEFDRLPPEQPGAAATSLSHVDNLFVSSPSVRAAVPGGAPPGQSGSWRVPPQRTPAGDDGVPPTPPHYPSEHAGSTAPLYNTSGVRGDGGAVGGVIQTPASGEEHAPEAAEMSASLQRSARRAKPIPLPFFKPAGGSTVLVDIASVTAVLYHEVNTRRFLKRLIYSIIYFAIVATIVTLHTDVTDAHYLTTFLSNTFVKPRLTSASDKTLTDISTSDELYLWFDRVWAPGLFANFSVDQLADDTRVMLTDYNKLPPSRYVADIPLYCHDGLVEGSFSINDRTYVAVETLDYPEGNIQSGKDFFTVFRINAQSYGSSGGLSAMRTVTNLSSARAGITELSLDGFFRESSTLETEIVVYNPYLDLVGSLRIVFDISDAGAITPFAPGSVLQVIRLRYRGTGRDTARFILELFFMVMTFLDALFTYASIRRARRRGASVLAYFTSRSWAWNCFEVIYVVVALVVFALHLRLYIALPALPDPVQLIDGRFDTFSDVYAASKSMNCILIFLSGVKLVRFMGSLPGFSVIFESFKRIVLPLLTFVVLTLILCIGFSVAGLYAFGASDPKMHTFGRSLQTVISFLTGDVSYQSLTGPETDVTNGVFPPIYYWAMFFALSVVVLGIVVAIAVVSYARARSGEAERDRIREAVTKWHTMAPRTNWRGWVPGAGILDPFPKTLLETLGDGGKRWIVPIMHDYKAARVVVAEVGGGTLRVYLGVQSWFQRKLVGARGFAVVLPSGAFMPGISRNHKGAFAKVRPGQALRLTTEPLVGAQELDFIVDSGVLRTKGAVDLGMAQDHQVVLEFPGVINDAYHWPNSEVVVSVDTVKRIATYGGSFTHSPADWLVCAVGVPQALSVCPFLVLEPHVPLEELLHAVENSGVEVPEDYWRHSVICLAQLFSRTVDAESQRHASPRVNPLDTESAWVRDEQGTSLRRHSR